MNCKEVQKLLQLYHDKELDEKKSAELETHLTECSECQLKLAELTAIDTLLLDANDEKIPDPGEHYWHSFPTRIQKALTTLHEPLIKRRKLRRMNFRFLPYLSAGVAVILAIFLSISFIKEIPTKFSENETKAMQKEITFDTVTGIKKLARTEIDSKKSEAEDVLAPFPINPNTSLSEQTLESVSTDTKGISSSRQSAKSQKNEFAVTGRGGSGLKTKTQPQKEPNAKVEANKDLLSLITLQGQVEERELTEADGLSSNSVVSEGLSDSNTYTYRRLFTLRSGIPQPGTLKVNVDTTGQLLNIEIYRSSGDAEADKQAIKIYRKRWAGHSFKKDSNFYVPFSKD